MNYSTTSKSKLKTNDFAEVKVRLFWCQKKSKVKWTSAHLVF